MRKNLSKMECLEVILFLCSVVTFMVSNCEAESENNSEKANLRKLSSELDLSSIEASIENEETLRRIVKRLAPEKNGVTGQPGVDFPALTTIPATSFSCRGLKGGYYADLETNCQVFHICDNGRKISFLCPNGTIFQQSQLICDWWFKVDCSKSTELYEQSSEQLLEEERRRAESRKSRLDYQQSIESNGQQDYYDVQSLSYDGKQNGRIKPYEEPSQENQVQSNRERIKSSRYFDSGNNFNSQESNSPRDNDQSSFTNGIQSNNQPKQQQQFNQFASRNIDEGDRHSTTDYYHSTPKKAQNYHVVNRNSNSQRDDKGALKRLKFKGLNRGNFTAASSQRVTPAYTESTTFRGGSNTSPAKESQQFAESAAFVSNRGNRFNENTGNTHQYYYQLYVNRDPTTRSTDSRRGNENDVSTQRNDYSLFTDAGPTYYETTTTQYPTATDACNDETEATSTYVDAQPTTESLLFANSNYEYRGSLRTTGANVRSSFVNKSYYNSNSNRESSRATAASNTGTIPPTTRSYVTTDTYRQNTITPSSSSQQRYTTNYVTGTPTASFRSNNFGRSTEKPTIDRLNVDAKLASKSPTTVSPGSRQNSISTIDGNQSNRLNVGAKLIGKGLTTVSPGSRQNSISTIDSNRPNRLNVDAKNPTTTVYRQNSISTIDSNQSNRLNVDAKGPTTTVYRQNSISTTTEKPFRSTAAYQPSTVTEKDLSPYDRSFTYKQGKVMSTLGPYVPFTKNYAHTSSSGPASKPTPYTATVPTYTTSYTSAGTRTLTPKLKYPAPTSLSKIKPSAAREHALSMLHSLKSLEHNVPSLSEVLRGNEPRVSNVSAPPAASTLHSLALYFSTATENFDSNETTDSSVSAEAAEKSSLSRKSNGTVQVPTSLLTRHTIDTYAQLFKLNDDDAETNNVTTEERSDDSSSYGEDDSTEDDLELQQSGGSLDDLRKSNSTRLRELAQVFTHALSAYLLDPDSFKRVLTEIRPTEPSKTTEESDDSWKTTTPYPTGEDEESTSSTKEKDEVLDFSDDGNDARHKLTTVYPTTFEPPTTTVQENVYDTLSTLPSTYYATTPRVLSSQEDSTNAYFETSEPPTEESTFTSDASFYGQNNVESTVTNDPFDLDIGNQSRVGGFQNNSAVSTVVQPIEMLLATTPVSDNYVVSPTPLSPSTFVHMTYNWNKKSTSRKPEQQLTPPFFDGRSETIRKATSRVTPESYSSSTPVSTTVEDSLIPHRSKSLLHDSSKPRTELKPGVSLLPTLRSSYMKFRDLYNRITDEREASEKPATTTVPVTESTINTSVDDTTPCADDDSSILSVDQREDSKVLENDHWTSSPAVTHLWETSVFVDPQRINHDLESDLGPSTVTTGASDERGEYENTPSLGEDVSSSSDESFVSEEEDVGAPFSSQRLSRDKDSPTTFSLLPASFSSSTVENTVTPKPLITTRSSITTTITSSITASTNSLPRDTLGYNSLLPYAADTGKSKSNGTENEIAERLFGKLNATTTDALMRVMKQVDNNETVRQLVLLLIRHCRDPADKTLQREREELLNALLRLPVNEFSSEDSRNAVAGINRLGLPADVKSTGRARSADRSTPSTLLATDPPVTTFRSRKSRRFRTTTENSASIVRRSEKTAASTDENNRSLGDEAASASDNRALELLRSLYTIATKWG
ncbi:mucin-5AC-like isoform X2 [Frieseomelitta varia]|uniref:mucin-5AC-like isoform X2 n=1 Tax=Frieseomelitta varia TaxID=561572 RepID=UPI001CB68F90|nr:mucin-5AC-like isoform X2 [Frieseomelitta varia]